MFAAVSNNTQKSTSWVSKVVSRFAQKTAPLPTLSQAMAGRSIADSKYQGIRQIPLSQIKGTASDCRSHDFDENFRMTNKHNRSRLDGVRQARQQLASLPPISLVAVGNDYYVQDGHHRVSVFNECEQDSITAHVTVLKLS
ncbi:hypothetical protein [Candidatus Leptofilum sp.]|uniref:hypothetical protein n=1 Tax=Candidatus Leptofilum sp. TaxID=3241576 RepID=UPI003B596D69